MPLLPEKLAYYDVDTDTMCDIRTGAPVRTSDGFVPFHTWFDELLFKKPDGALRTEVIPAERLAEAIAVQLFREMRRK